MNDSSFEDGGLGGRFYGSALQSVATRFGLWCLSQWMLPFYSYTFILIIVCAVFFYRAGEFEQTSGLAWAAMSAVISIMVWRGLHGGFFSVFLGQIALYFGITLYRSRKDP